jgi:hypothetical protein
LLLPIGFTAQRENDILVMKIVDCMISNLSNTDKYSLGAALDVVEAAKQLAIAGCSTLYSESVSLTSMKLRLLVFIVACTTISRSFAIFFV